MKKLWLKIFPKYKKKFWYNASIYIPELGYDVYDDNDNYIPCTIGLIINFDDNTSWKVTHLHKAYGNWRLEEDSIYCDLKRIS